MKRRIIASILCLVFLFTVSGMALGAPKNGLYVNGHRYELTLSKGDAAYMKFLADLKDVAWNWTKVIIVNNDQFAEYQDAVDEGSISDVMQDDAQSQVGQSIPATVIPIANDGTESPSEPVGDVVIEDIVYESTADLSTTSVSVANGTAEAAAIALLQNTVAVTGTKSETGTASIAWTIAGYNATTAGDYTATGVLTLPAGWTGSADDVTATVTVEAPLPPAYESTAALTTASISVPNETAEADAIALLQTSVEVTSTKGETGSAAIAWTIAGYNADAAGDYTATGVLTLPEGWTGSADDVTATVTVEAPAGFSTAIEVIQNAIDKFQPVNATGKFTGKVYNVKTVGTATVNKCDFKTEDTWTKANKTQQSKMTVNITPVVQTSDKDITTPNFPFAEIIVGSGIGAQAVAGGVLTADDNFYYIQLTNADCPASVLAIIDTAGNIGSTKMYFLDQKAKCKITVSKATGLVISVEEITITGKTQIYKSLLNAANGTYDNEFWNKDGPITYSY